MLYTLLNETFFLAIGLEALILIRLYVQILLILNLISIEIE